MNKSLWLMVAVLLLAGCAAKPLPPSKTAQEALSHNRAALRAEEAGDLPLALLELRASLQLYAAIDEREGMVVDLINLARLKRRAGDYPAALETVQLALELSRNEERLQGEAALEQGLIQLAAGDTDAALMATKVALAVKDGESLTGRALNLRGRIELLQGDPAAARQSARAALASHAGADPRRETANSWRLLGDVALAAGEGAEAEGAYGEALGRDRMIGSSERVVDDLFGLGQGRQQRGALAEADEAYQRALDAALNGGFPAKAAAILLRRAEVLRQRGDEAAAQACERQRDGLPSLSGGGRPVVRGFSP